MLNDKCMKYTIILMKGEKYFYINEGEQELTVGLLDKSLSTALRRIRLRVFFFFH